VIGYLVTYQDMNQQTEADRWELDPEPPAELDPSTACCWSTHPANEWPIIAFSRPQANDALMTTM